MRVLRSLIICALLLLSTFGLVRAAQDFYPHPRSFKVGNAIPVPKSTGGRVLAATVTGGTYTVTRATTIINADGSQQITLVYTNASAQQVHIRTLLIDAACTRVLDTLGNTVSATGPTAECTALSSFATAEDTAIGNAATGGKLNL